MCDCPSDWVACFRKDCERGVNIKEAARKQWEAFRRLNDERQPPQTGEQGQ